MYRKGLTVRQIAELCGAVRGTVASHVRVASASDPDLLVEHQRNAPEKKPSPIWLARFDALQLFKEQRGRFPSPKSQDADDRKLARWLTDQRAQFKAGSLTEQKLGHMAALPGWETPQRPRIDAERWERRLDELQAYKAEHGRWPRPQISMTEDVYMGRKAVHAEVADVLDRIVK